MTVLFYGLANSTALAERLGPEHRHTLLNSFFALALDAVHRYEGTINQFFSDGFMALFGAPLAHEDHAWRAVLAALALQHLLQGHQAELGEPYGVTCVFRMGLNTGFVVADRNFKRHSRPAGARHPKYRSAARAGAGHASQDGGRSRRRDALG